MAFLGLYGAHACGKTTTIRKFWEEIESGKQTFEPHVRLTIIHADNNNTEYRYDRGVISVKDRTKGRSPWKDKAEGKRALVRDCVADDSRIYMVESVRFDIHTGVADAYVECDGGAFMVFVTVNWKTMRYFLVERCNARDKTFREEYWTPNKLAYEGFRRYVNQAAKYLQPVGVPYEVFEMDMERKNWDEIIAHLVMCINTPIGDWYRDQG